MRQFIREFIKRPHAAWLARLLALLLSSSGCPGGENEANLAVSGQTEPGVTNSDPSTGPAPTTSGTTENTTQAPTTGETCTPGHETCSCYLGECLGDLVCQNNKCILPEGSTSLDETNTGASSTTDLGTSTGTGETTTVDTSSSTTTTGDTGTSTTTDTTGEPAVCGNGIQEGAEACDDGNDNEYDDCTFDCKVPACGDGLVQKENWAEECDDGNQDNTDECTNECKVASCGDTFVQPLKGEQCDDGANGNNDDGCTDLCLAPQCGDGFAQPQNNEECDDGNKLGTDGCSSSCTWEKKIIFITSTYSKGNMGGLTGVKNTCKTLAKTAGLSGTFLPWIADGNMGFWPAKDFVKWQGTYVNRNNKVIAYGWENLLTGEHKDQINIDEKGIQLFLVPPAYLVVWTGTWSNDGTPGGEDCGGWTISDNSNFARTGNGSKLDTSWMNYLTYECSREFKLYCVEQ